MIAIIDYRAGNLTSVKLAFDQVGAESEISSDPARILGAERVVFPGVGAAGAAMHNLQELGLAEVVREVVAAGRPFLGICLGTQIVFERSDEDGGVACLGILPGAIRRFTPGSRWDKVPQIGWNRVDPRRPHPLFAGIEEATEFYFVHSYYPVPDEPALILAETDYAGVRFASVVGKANLVATQFHPEKSGRAGLRLLRNFAAWNGNPAASPEAVSC
jgi:glutamine amidotransferase